jgi:hypothetical protein
MSFIFIAVHLLLLASTATNDTAKSDDGLVTQIAQGMNMADIAVACGVRTSEWRKSVRVGYLVEIRLTMGKEHQKATDEEVEMMASKIFRAANLKAKDRPFAVPTQVTCRALDDSKDMTDVETAAQLGLIFGAAGGEQ